MTKLALLSDPEVRVARLPGEIAVISLLGEHDVTTALEVRNAIAFALDQGTHLVVDLSETEFIDSSIVHALVDSVQLTSAQGLRISLQLQTHASVKRMLEIMLEIRAEALPVYGTRAEAIDAVRQTLDRSSAVGIGREPQQWKGGKNGVALGSNHLARPVRRHWRTRDHEVPLLRADRGSAPGVDRILHTRNRLRRAATVPFSNKEACHGSRS
jgi:anti-anti-sigma factor